MKQKLITYREPKLTTTARQVSKSLLNTSTSAANKAIQGLAKHQSETNETNNRYINIMEAQQSINFIFAIIKLGNRRMHREIEHERLAKTGKEDGYIRIAWGWIVDYTVYVLYLIWGILQPIVLILVMMVVMIVIMIVCTLFYLYLSYLFLTAIA